MPRNSLTAQELSLGSCELRAMPHRVPERSDDNTVYLVLNDHGRLGIAYDETDPAEADLETIIGNFLTGQYGNALQVVAFNIAEGWAIDVSEDIAREILQRAVDADENLGEDTKRFIDRHVADATNPGPRAQTSPIDLIDSLKSDFEKRPAAPSVRRGAKYYIRQRP
jgi:hypothetical protein